MTTQRSPADGHRTWQQTKSELTRTSILDAALGCFHDLGYNSTTTEKIAQRAGVSRGAMLHHFPSRQALIAAAVEHLNARRLEAYESEESEVQGAARYTRIEAGIDKFWEQLNHWHHVVWVELQIAARTDEELRAVLLPAMEAYRVASLESTRRLFPDLALSGRFDLATSLTRYLLEGLAFDNATRDDDRAPTVDRTALIEYLKAQLREMFSDVHERVDRESAREAAADDPGDASA